MLQIKLEWFVDTNGSTYLRDIYRDIYMDILRRVLPYRIHTSLKRLPVWLPTAVGGLGHPCPEDWKNHPIVGFLSGLLDQDLDVQIQWIHRFRSLSSKSAKGLIRPDFSWGAIGIPMERLKRKFPFNPLDQLALFDCNAIIKYYTANNIDRVPKGPDGKYIIRLLSEDVAENFGWITIQSLLTSAERVMSFRDTFVSPQWGKIQKVTIGSYLRKLDHLIRDARTTGITKDNVFSSIDDMRYKFNSMINLYFHKSIAPLALYKCGPSLMVDLRRKNPLPGLSFGLDQIDRNLNKVDEYVEEDIPRNNVAYLTDDDNVNILERFSILTA
jgi:hypothetical protein